MNSPTGNLQEGTDPKTDGEGINLPSLYRTLVRVLVNLDAGEYTGNVQQSTVRQHDALPDQASDLGTREAK